MASKTVSHDSPIPPLNKNPRNPPVGAKRKSRYRDPVQFFAEDERSEFNRGAKKIGVTPF